jgi:hypothetical protein
VSYARSAVRKIAPPPDQSVLDQLNEVAFTLDQHTEALHTIRYGRMPKENVDALCRRLVADVRALRVCPKPPSCALG